MGRAVTGEIEPDRPLTDAEKAQLASGKPLWRGNGVRPSFADLPPETLAEYQERRIETMRRNRQARKLAELDAYIDAHRQYAATIFGAKLAVIDGLLAEMKVIDPNTHEEKIDTTLLDDKRLKVLLSAITEFEKTSGMKAKQEKAETVTVNVSHIVSDLKKSLSK